MQPITPTQDATPDNSGLRSYAEPLELSCAECGVVFDDAVWLLVVAAQRPDLWEACRDRHIHDVFCPNGHSVSIDAPLVIYDANHHGRLFLLPADEFTLEERQTVALLTQRLAKTLVAEGLPLPKLETVVRSLLPFALITNSMDAAKRLSDLITDLKPAAIPEPESRARICREALGLFQRSDHPVLWSEVQHNLGVSLLRLPDVLQTPGIIEEAIVALHSVEHGSPERNATVQWRLAEAYSVRKVGDPAENQERAIEAYRNALTSYQAMTDSQAVGNIQNRLGSAFLRRGFGTREENVRQAIGYFGAASEEPGLRKGRPLIWARRMGNVGMAQLEKFADRAQSVEAAIAAFRRALRVLSPTNETRADWAWVQSSLARALAARIRGNSAQNMEEAIGALEAALTVRTKQSDPLAWAMTLNYLGNCFLERKHGGRAENIEQAIAAFSNALTVFSRREMPERWAGVRNNLGISYYQRLLGNAADNLKKSRTAFHDAVRWFNRVGARRDAAMAMSNLANVYSELAHERPELTQRYQEGAIRYGKKALAVGMDVLDNATHARTLANLTVLFRERQKGNASRNQEEAIRYGEAALGFFKEADYPGDRASTLNNLGNLYANRYRGRQSDNLIRARACFLDALQVFDTDNYPFNARQTATNLARIEVLRGDLAAGYHALKFAAKGFDRLFSEAQTEAARQAEIAQSTEVISALIDVALRFALPRRRPAFLHSEEARSRLLRNQISALIIPSPSSIPEALLSQEAARISQLRGEEQRQRRVSLTDAESLARTRLLRQELQTIWRSMEDFPETEDYLALRRGERLTWAMIQGWLDAQEQETAFVGFYGFRDRMLAFTVRRDRKQPAVETLDVNPTRVTDTINRFQREVAARASSDAGLRETWKGVSTRLLSPILPQLRGVERIYVAPFGSLHNLPFHAMDVEGVPLIERFEVVYTPSASVAIRAFYRAKQVRTTEGEILVVGNPSNNLPNAEQEARTVGDAFGVTPLLAERATREAVLRELAGKSILHFASHAAFHSMNPFLSGIDLANGDRLTAQDILASSLTAHLVALSGCETGVHAVVSGDELLGLARAFLYAGAPTVLMSQWKAHDASTRAMMEHFYRRMRTGQSAASALRHALMALRSTVPHIFYWAPFILFGDGG